MFKPLEMQKVRIIALKSVVAELIAELHKLGILEIASSEFPGLDTKRPLPNFSELSSQLLRVRALKSMLKPVDYAIEKMDGKEASELLKSFTIENELKELNDRVSNLNSEIQKLNEYAKIVRKIKHFGDIDFSKLETSSLTYQLGTIASDKIESIKSKLDKTGQAYNIIFHSISERELVILILHQKGKDISSIITDSGFLKVQLPENLSTPERMLSMINSRLTSAENERSRLLERINSYSKNYYAKVCSIERALQIESDRAEIASRFGFSSSVFLLGGWVKSSDFEKLNSTLSSKFHDKVFVGKEQYDEHHELPPTVLDNPKYASPFEFLTSRYSLPNSREIDPTMIYMITIPLLYGMIVGDVAYGILSIMLSRFLLSKFKSSQIMQSVCTLWFLSAFPSIAFGVIFDEWMGASHFHWLEIFEKWGLINLESLGIYTSLYQGFSRIHELPALIGITALIGLVHLGIGFLLGAINEWSHSKKHAIAKIAWIGVEIGGTLAVTSLVLNILPADQYGNIGVGILGLSVVALAATEGVIGILEVPGLAGNVLSYSRIAAIGVVGVILAEIITEFMTPLPEHGIFGLLLLPLFLLLHAVNTFIAMFESLIHGGRLNILEFRSKFLKGGGKPFEPFVLEP